MIVTKRIWTLNVTNIIQPVIEIIQSLFYEKQLEN